MGRPPSDLDDYLDWQERLESQKMSGLSIDDFCGDGALNGPEECDLGPGFNDASYEGCNPDCTRAPRCGDGVADSSREACDDGGYNNDDEWTLERHFNSTCTGCINPGTGS